jgi:hypothetical protein
MEESAAAQLNASQYETVENITVIRLSRWEADFNEYTLQ